MDAVATELLKVGPLGAIIIAMAIYIWRRDKEHRHERDRLMTEITTIHERRIADSHAVTTTVLQLNDKWNGTVNSFATIMDAQKDTMVEVREALRDLRPPPRGR